MAIDALRRGRRRRWFHWRRRRKEEKDQRAGERTRRERTNPASKNQRRKGSKTRSSPSSLFSQFRTGVCGVKQVPTATLWHNKTVNEGYTHSDLYFPLTRRWLYELVLGCSTCVHVVDHWVVYDDTCALPPIERTKGVTTLKIYRRRSSP